MTNINDCLARSQTAQQRGRFAQLQGLVRVEKAPAATAAKQAARKVANRAAAKVAQHRPALASKRAAPRATPTRPAA